MTKETQRNEDNEFHPYDDDHVELGIRSAICACAYPVPRFGRSSGRKTNPFPCAADASVTQFQVAASRQHRPSSTIERFSRASNWFSIHFCAQHRVHHNTVLASTSYVPPPSRVFRFLFSTVLFLFFCSLVRAPLEISKTLSWCFFRPQY